MSLLRGHANGMVALLRQRCVVDDQHSVVSPDKPVRLHEQFRLQRCRIPDTGRHEMMQLVITARNHTLRHRLNTLPLARSDQSRYVEWTHSPPGLVPQTIEERLEPALKLGSPIQPRAHRDRPPTSRSLRNHRYADSGIPKAMPSAIICQSSARAPAQSNDTMERLSLGVPHRPFGGPALDETRVVRRAQLPSVIPAQAGIQVGEVPQVYWIPACAGMTEEARRVSGFLLGAQRRSNSHHTVRAQLDGDCFVGFASSQ
jgi:hypothetical protein